MNYKIASNFPNNLIIAGILFTFFLLFSQILLSQNQQQLDVEGNINLTGEMLLNNQAGFAGQFPLSNGDGTMSWAGLGSAADFNFNRSISYSKNGAWTVPAGVTEIMVEIWGAGGAGNFSGGGSGAYLLTAFEVTPGTGIPIAVGVGGVSGGTEDGGHSQLSYGGIAYRAEGGKAALFSRTNNSSGSFVETTPGEGAAASNGTVSFGYSVAGNDGTRGGYAATDNVTGGNGANAPFSDNSGGRGARFYLLSNAFFFITSSTDGNSPGGGGGGFDGIANTSAVNGDGGDGLIRIYFYQP